MRRATAGPRGRRRLRDGTVGPRRSADGPRGSGQRRHLLPFLVRAGNFARLELAPDLPLGLFAEASYHSTSRVLEPGDRLVVVTDGVLETTGHTPQQ
jgi:hypothetical protein